MALEGSYDYKGIDISDAYVKITNVTWSTTGGNWHASVYKDKAARDANPNGQICSVSGTFNVDLKDSAKNPVTQAYVAAKTVDTYKDMADA